MDKLEEGGISPKSVTVRLSADLHRSLKLRVLEDDTTLQAALVQMIQKYVKRADK